MTPRNAGDTNIMEMIPEAGARALLALLQYLYGKGAVENMRAPWFCYEARADFSLQFTPIKSWFWGWSRLTECIHCFGAVEIYIFYKSPEDPQAIVFWEFWDGDRKTVVVGLADRETGSVWLQKAVVVAYLSVLEPKLQPLVATLLKIAWLLE